MSLHKDLKGNIHDDMDGAALHLLPAGCVQITRIEADAILKPTFTPEQVAKAQRLALDEEERQQARLDTAILALVNATPVQCVTYARANFPSLTLPEQNKIGVILNILSVAVRNKLR